MLSYFSQYGEVVDCVVMKNQETGKSRGFGFVTFKDPSCCETVLAVKTHIIDGRQVCAFYILFFLNLISRSDQMVVTET